MNALLVIFRTVHYASAMLLLGELVFALFVALPAVYRDRGGEDARRFWKIARFCLIAAIASGAAWLLTASALMSGLPIGDAMAGKTIGLILGNTLFGQVFAVRAGLLLALGAMLVVLSRASDDARRLRLMLVTLVLAAMYLGSLAGAGHAVAGDEGGNSPRIVADIVHLLAAGAWLGALPALVSMLGHARMPQEAASALRRFSTLGVICVGSLILSGVINSWYEVGTFPALIGTDYGRLLLAKLLLFAAMLGLAAVNRGLSLQLASKEDSAALQRVRRNAMFEVVFGMGVIAIVGALGVVVPATHEPVIWPFDYTLGFDSIAQSAWMQLVVVATGTAACIAAIALIAGALGRPPRVRMVAVAGIIIPAALLVALLAVPAYPTTYRVSTVPYSADAIATGATLYAANCSSCHGPTGRELNLNDRVPQRREGELFWSIAHGIPATTMPGFAAHLSEVEIWSLVQFLDAQVAAVNALALADGLKPLLPVPAPDFTYEFTGRQQESLRQQREDHVALLVFYTLPSSLPRLRELAMLENAYTAAGAVVIAMPMPASSAATNLARPNGGESILAFTSPGVAATYRMFAQQSSEQTGEPAGGTPTHVEYLIDRFGYIRVRWLGAPESSAGQADALQRQIDILAHEPPRRQILWGHRH